jgi:F-type H+-transporting ATPase subunit delta
MKDKVLISRYAEAFISYMKELKSFETALEDCRQLKSVIRDSPELIMFLRNPEIAHAEKIDFIGRVLWDALSVEGVNLVKLLLDKGRIGILPDVVEYIRAKYAHEGEIEVLLRAASLHELDVIKDVEDTLRKKLGVRLKFYLELDGRLLGGMQVIVGNTIIDGSVRKRLGELRTKLESIRV